MMMIMMIARDQGRPVCIHWCSVVSVSCRRRHYVYLLQKGIGLYTIYTIYTYYTYYYTHLLLLGSSERVYCVVE